MFGRKKAARKPATQLTLLRADKTIISAFPIGEYALPEKVVLALSSEYFNDPDPCEIHRSAVHKRAMMELMERCPMDKTVYVCDLPEFMRGWFSEETAAVQIGEKLV